MRTTNPHGPLRIDSHSEAFCWESDPFPSEDFPNVTPSERRYFHYYTISKKLGVSGKKNRAKLPACVTKKIAEMYPDEEGTPTKVLAGVFTEAARHEATSCTPSEPRSKCSKFLC